MKNKLLLYIDILGFSDLVSRSPEKVDDLYEVIASLNMHNHDAFKCVIFSDTILVYNIDGGDGPEDMSYLIMFMCEFAKDLLHRLTNRNIVFRAVITHGHFRHYQLNDIPCFYGMALIKAHSSEKKIKAIGLFLDNNILKYCDIFHTIPYDNDYSFVFITQSLNEIESLYNSNIQGIGVHFEQTSLIWSGGPELLHLSYLLKEKNSDLPDDVKNKYINTIDLYRKKYPKILACLESNNLDLTKIAPSADWSTVIERHPEDCSYAIDKKHEF